MNIKKRDWQSHTYSTKDTYIHAYIQTNIHTYVHTVYTNECNETISVDTYIHTYIYTNECNETISVDTYIHT